MSNTIDAMLLRRIARMENSIARIQTLMECVHSQLHQFNSPRFTPSYNVSNSDTESNDAEQPVTNQDSVGQAG